MGMKKERKNASWKTRLTLRSEKRILVFVALAVDFSLFGLSFIQLELGGSKWLAGRTTMLARTVL